MEPSESKIAKESIEHVSQKEVDEVIFTENEFPKEYLIKTALVTQAIDEIGFGRYQIGLFFVTGFGWFADNAWPVATSLILSRLNEVNGVHAPTGRAPYLTLAQNLGLLAGALFWSLSADIIGRKLAFSTTFLITGIWSVIAGSSPNFASICIFASFWSFGVGGNLPVDSSVFIENVPSKYSFLLTVLSGYWALGQLVTNLISWGLIANYSCSDTSSICRKQDNRGWRYFLFTLGGLTLVMFFVRFAFNVFESPKFYIARGQDEKAIETLQKIAKINGKVLTLTIEDLRQVETTDSERSSAVSISQSTNKFSLVKQKMSKYRFNHIKETFGSKRLAFSSALVISAWGLIGLAFPLYNAFLPYYLETRGDANKPLSVHDTYRNSLIVSVIGIPGAIIAGIMVEFKIGRKGVLCSSLFLTGIFLFVSTTAKTSNANLGWNCAFSFCSNIMYGVLYAYTPEIFPARVRGTGVGLAASVNRVMGVFSPIIAIFANLETSAPIFVSGALFLFSGVLVLFFPYETRGKKIY